MSTRRSYIITPMGIMEIDTAVAAIEAEAVAIEAALTYASLTATRIHSEAQVERAAVEEARLTAVAALSRVQSLGRQASAAVSLLGAAEAQSADLASATSAARDGLQEAALKVAFVTRDADTAAAALQTLTTMERQGYRLRESITRGGLTAYFASADGSHEIAVRHRAQEVGAETSARWEIEAETFGTKGEECLYLLEDFETAYAESLQGDLLPCGPPRYPKRDGESLIPAPPAQRLRGNIARQSAREAQ